MEFLAVTTDHGNEIMVVMYREDYQALVRHRLALFPNWSGFDFSDAAGRLQPNPRARLGTMWCWHTAWPLTPQPS